MKQYLTLLVAAQLAVFTACTGDRGAPGSVPNMPERPYTYTHPQAPAGGTDTGLNTNVPGTVEGGGATTTVNISVLLEACSKDAVATGVIKPECAAIMKPILDAMAAVAGQKKGDVAPTVPAPTVPKSGVPDSTVPPVVSTPESASLLPECITTPDDVLASIAKINPLLSKALAVTLDAKLDSAGKLSPAVASSASEVRVGSMGVSSLEGVRCFPETYLLEAAKSEITDLSPLVGLGLLNMLDLPNNKVTDLTPLLGLKSLQTFAGLKGLESVDLRGNPLKNECQVFDLVKKGVDVQYFPNEVYDLRKQQCEGKCPAISIPSLKAQIQTLVATGPAKVETVTAQVVGGKAMLILKDTQKLQSAALTIGAGDAPISCVVGKNALGATCSGSTLSFASPTNQDGVLDVKITDGCGQTASVGLTVAPAVVLNVPTASTVSADVVDNIHVDATVKNADSKSQFRVNLIAKDGKVIKSTSLQYMENLNTKVGTNGIPGQVYTFEASLPTSYKLADIASIQFFISDPNGDSIIATPVSITVHRVYLETVGNSGFVYDASPGTYHKSSGTGTPFTIPMSVNVWKIVQSSVPAKV